MSIGQQSNSLFRSRVARIVASVTLAVALALFQAATTFAHGATSSATVSVFATGLNNPRGLTFGPDGRLYVAEGGLGGTHSTVGLCTQVVAPVGPYTSGFTARISAINSKGQRTTVVNHLPSSQTSAALGSLVSGVADVQFVGGTLFALLSGAGCSHGIASVPNGILRVQGDEASVIANLSHFIRTHPVAHPNPPDFEPDGTWFSMVQVGNALYALEPNHGELDRIALNANGSAGTVSRVADISESQGHIVPTAVAFHNGAFYIANLNTFPIVPGSSRLLRISLDGHVSVVTTGLTAVLGLAFHNGALYGIEMTTAPGNPTPGTGKVVRIESDGDIETVASGLTFPTGLAFGPDGKLYVSVNGFGFPAGAGQIVRLSV